MERDGKLGLGFTSIDRGWNYTNNREKVLLGSHQFSGLAADWWDAYMEAHEEPESINWSEFRATFRAHHVPQGVIKLKKEFQDLK
jgi:hypothetical protein